MLQEQVSRRKVISCTPALKTVVLGLMISEPIVYSIVIIKGCPHHFNTGKDAVNSIVLHPNEAELIVGDQQGNIKIYDLQADKLRLKMTPCPDVGIRSLTIAQNASYLIAADSSGSFHVYGLQNTDLNVQYKIINILGGLNLLYSRGTPRLYIEGTIITRSQVPSNVFS